jgi:hypothetical protein
MAVSGTTYYQLTRDQIITAAIRKLGVLAEGQAPSTQNISDGAMSLNTAIAELKTLGMPLWTRTSYTFTPTTNSYTIGVGMTLNTVFPVHLLQVIRTSSNTNIDIEIVGKQNFSVLPLSTSGSPLKVCYTPGINMGTLEIWPTPPSTNTDTLTLIYQRPYNYMLSASDTLDFPEEWYNALIYKLAVLLAPEWGVALPDRQMLRSEAGEYIASAMTAGQEDGSLFIAPARR